MQVGFTKPTFFENPYLNDLTILVKVSDPRQVNNSLFSTSYILYDISTPQFNWVVNRRYSDFINLRTALQNQFPNNLVPPLPGKKMGGRRFELDFVSKRNKSYPEYDSKNSAKVGDN